MIPPKKPVDREIPCYCCRRPWLPRGWDGLGGKCCDGSHGDHCINCLKCVYHCTCRGQRVRGYYTAWLIRDQTRGLPERLAKERAEELGEDFEDFNQTESAGEFYFNGSEDL